jgi:hypothetical protein
MKARSRDLPFETGTDGEMPFRYWGVALALAAAGSWAVTLGAAWLVGALL